MTTSQLQRFLQVALDLVDARIEPEDDFAEADYKLRRIGRLTHFDHIALRQLMKGESDIGDANSFGEDNLLEHFSFFDGCRAVDLVRHSYRLLASRGAAVNG
jgi:hypothetical protein